MRVLYVAPYVPSRLRTRPFHLLQGVVRAGHQVTAVVLSAAPVEGESTDDLKALGVDFRVIHRPKLRALVNCVRALPSRLPLHVGYCLDLEQRLVIQRLLQNRALDVLHVEHLRAAAYGMATTGLPGLYDAVDCMTLLRERTRAFGHGRQRLIASLEVPRTRRFEARALARYDKITVSSSTDADALRALAPLSPAPVVLPNGVDWEYFGSLQRQPEADLLVFTGIMRYHANSAAMLTFCHDTLPIIRRHHPHVRLLIVGSSPGPEILALRRLPGVTVTGYVPDLRPYLSRASVAISPLAIGVGTQYKVLESAAAGVPIVASGLVSRPLAMKDGEHLLVGDSAVETANAICRLLSDGKLAHRLTQAAAAHVRQNFNWSASTQILMRLYRDMVGVSVGDRMP